MSGVRRVIVGVSASPGSLPALRYAAGIACQEEAPLIAVHAWVPPGGEMAERRHPSPDLWKVWEKAARHRLQKAINSAWGCVPAGLDLQPLVRRAEPGPGLVEVAHGRHDLLVVGAGRHATVARAWHGRVSRYCVAHARCPVLTVPPPALAQTAGHGLRAWSSRHRELTVDRALPCGPDGQKLRRDRRGD